MNPVNKYKDRRKARKTAVDAPKVTSSVPKVTSSVPNDASELLVDVTDNVKEWVDIDAAADELEKMTPEEFGKALIEVLEGMSCAIKKID